MSDLSVDEPPPREESRGRMPGCLLFAILAGVSVVCVASLWFLDWTLPKPIRSSGGLYFFKPVNLNVPPFAQADSAWKDQRLGNTKASFGSEGCAVTSAAMVLKAYGHEIDPGTLNAFLTENGGYTEKGWLYWESAAEFPGVRAEKAYEDLPSHRLIDKNLLEGNPVIVRVRLPSGITHFVVISGKRGYEYLVMDPAIPDQKEAVELSSRFPKIEALRFYRKL